MRNKSLVLQIWFVFAGIMVGISILLILLVPLVVKPFFTQDIYTRIEDAQNTHWDRLVENPTQNNRENRPATIRSVRHMVLWGQGDFAPGYQLPKEFLTEAKKQALAQAEITVKYKKDIGNQTIYYIIRKGSLDGRQAYLLSYMGGALQRSLVQSLVRQISLVIVGVLIVSWPPSLFLARYLSRSLVNMEKQVQRMANRDWNEPLVLERNDEIGRLASSIEHMRQQLVRQDETQRSFLQNISHELKTPIMVIQSYAQSIHDGIYPKGSLSETVQVIDDESERLKNLVQKLLYMTKLDYLSSRQQEIHERIPLTPLIEAAVDRLRWHRQDIHWSLNLPNVFVRGENEQLRVAMENILDNHIRYASQQISILVEEKVTAENKKAVVIKFWNDGQPIEPEIISSLFEPFEKGGKGQFGLGLWIVKRIVDLYQGSVWVKNEDEGVSFYLQFPSE
jgi:two-component system, OmpR family, sensor histidine kinase CssS